jgi:DNA-binding response OmpR family regulator
MLYTARPVALNILLTDPDPRVRQAVSGVLTLHGHLVFEAADGHDAFLLSESLSRPLHLLITDVILDARLNGFDLARHMQVMRPGLPVLYLGSIPADEVARLDLESSLGNYLSKPFDARRLLAKVEAAARGPKRPAAMAGATGRQ